MTSSQARAARICGEQDCNERTGRPDHPLCYPHWQDSQGGKIDECPNHPGVYKPSEYDICRSCYSQRRQPAQSTPMTVSQQPQGDSRGWNLQPVPEVKTVSPEAIEAVNRVRQNITAHKRECENHETSTIQFLITPMLRGLGWDFEDPNQVRTEFNPEDKRRYGQSRVDIALLEKGSPKVFVEAKRLDREYDHGYLEQLGKYASFLREGGIAVLTNGRFWQVYAVAKGKTELQHTIDIADDDAESVVIKLVKAIGRAASRTSTQRQAHPKSVAKPSPDAISENLRQYREREARQRRQPAYTIFSNDTIALIAAHQPTDLRQLGNIKGVGPGTLAVHGAAILKIVRGER